MKGDTGSGVHRRWMTLQFAVIHENSQRDGALTFMPRYYLLAHHARRESGDQTLEPDQ